MSVPAEARPAGGRGLAPRLALGLLVVAVFGVTLGGDFVYDDRFIIVDNPWVGDPGKWTRFFLEDSWAGIGVRAYNYRPLPLLTFGLNHLAGGLEPAGYHLVNLLLHLSAALLLFAIAGRIGLSNRGAWLAAALFAVHPLQAEPVAEIVGRMDLMAGTAFLGSLLCHVGARRRPPPDPRGRALLAGAVVLYAAGLLSKEHVILLPLAAAVYDLRLSPGSRRRVLPVYAAYAAVAVAYLAVRAAVFDGELLAGEESLVDNPLALAPGPVRVISALGVAGLYLRHAALPVGLSPDYCYAQILPLESALGARAAAIAAGALLLLAGAAVLARRSGRATFALAIAACAFLPVSNVPFPILTVMGDRLFYLPLAGLGLLAGLAVDRSPPRLRRAATGVTAAAVVVLAGLAVRQAWQWRDNLSLDRLAARNAPRCTRAHSNLGHDLLAAGDLEGAERSFRRSLEIFPEFDAAVAGLARVAFRRGENAESLRLARRALELRPDAPEVLALAGEVSRRLGDRAAARRYWERRLELEPMHSRTLSDLAILLWLDGESERAVVLWRRALEQPDAPSAAWLNLARALDRLGQREAAADAYRRYLEREAEDEAARDEARRRLRELEAPQASPG